MLAKGQRKPASPDPLNMLEGVIPDGRFQSVGKPMAESPNPSIPPIAAVLAPYAGRWLVGATISYGSLKAAKDWRVAGISCYFSEGRVARQDGLPLEQGCKQQK